MPLPARAAGLFSKMKVSLANQGTPTSAQVDPVTPAQDPTPPTPTTPPVAEPVVADLQAVAAAIPYAVQSADTLNNIPGGVASSAKEAPNLMVTVEKPSVDATGGVQLVELEKNPELPPEVESYVKNVESHPDQVPSEVVISDPQTGQSTPRVLAEPVIVLPLTPQMEKTGVKKSTKFSVRWLVEWSHKLMKIFSGKIVYRQSE